VYTISGINKTHIFVDRQYRQALTCL